MKNFKFTIKGHVYDVDILEIENNIAKVEVNGTVYEVEIHKQVKETKTPTIVRQNLPPSKEHKTLITSQITKINAPLPGNIMQIFVKEGDNVEKEDKLLMMEAMKMENTILAEKSGIIKSINVISGDSVLQGDTLLEIE
ncbi:MAG: biotin/lipoyl-binding protein [Bacteroidales bacterium]|nr:biotin/lipoyl-binding protein [Bacteroidales bacterium]